VGDRTYWALITMNDAKSYQNLVEKHNLVTEKYLRWSKRVTKIVPKEAKSCPKCVKWSKERPKMC
jgi:hypothetical protein